jgi:hypothetical protein
MTSTRKGAKVRARVAVGAPTSEIGRVSVSGILPWSAFTWIDQAEHVPELVWPNSVKTYNEMRTDSQVNGLYLGITLPIRRYKWMIAPNGAPDGAVELVAQDMNLPIQGSEDKKKSPLRTRDTFNWNDFLRHALLALAYGFYYFEPVGQIKNGQWRLTDVAPRPPSTITQVTVDDHGALVGVKQSVGTSIPEIPARNLVPFVWEREAGNWFGRSMFRHMYRHWLIKDRMYRVDAMKNERNGMGTPFFKAPQGASKAMLDDLNDLAQAWRAGDFSGAAAPAGTDAQLLGVTGTLPDTIATINMHDEAMARSLLMMFIQLGQTKSGSRALGDSFIDFFLMAQESIANWFEDTLSAFLLEDIVDWNFGEDVPAPRIVHERDPNPQLAIADLVSLIDKGAITVDPEFEAYIRARYLLPAKPAEETAPPAPPTPPAAPSSGPTAPGESTVTEPAPTQSVTARRRATVVAEGPGSLLPLPNRTLRRQPYKQEVAAKVDYAAMENDYNSAKAALVAAVKKAQGQQIKQLGEQIVTAKQNPTKLAAIAADPIHAATIQPRLVQMVQAGTAAAIQEAKDQGVTIAMPDLSNAIGRLAARSNAVDSLLASSLSNAAARKALSLAGGSLTPAEIASEVTSYLSGLSSQYLEDQLGGTLQQAMNAGRKEVISKGPGGDIYSSELLDSNTCDACVEIDGTNYPDLDAAEADYPTGGYMDCFGGPRCRGTLIAVYGEIDTGA